MRFSYGVKAIGGEYHVVNRTDIEMRTAPDFPLISLIVPTYNVERYLPECLEAIRRQSYSNIEVVIVIDGATDGSCDIARKISGTDGRFFVYEQANRGVGAARNTGIALSHGDFIAFVDPDDWIDENYIETLYLAQRHQNADIVICGYDRVLFRQNNDCRTRTVSPDPAAYFGTASVRRQYMNLLDARLIVSPWAKLYRSEIIRTGQVAFPELNRLEDIVFNYRYYNHVSAVQVIPYAGYRYRIEYENRLNRIDSRHNRTLAFLYDEIRTLHGNWGLKVDTRLATFLLNYIIAIAERNRLCRKGSEELLSDRDLQRIVRLSRPASPVKKTFRFFFLRKNAHWLNAMTDLKIRIKKFLVTA